VTNHEIIDLREPTAVVHLRRDDNPFASLTKEERLRVIIRVLCELVAYGESDAEGDAGHLAPATDSAIVL
jgi:hypothetical protein